VVQWTPSTKGGIVVTVDDTQLVLAARAGDEPAFAELVDRWLDRCWDVAWHILHDRDLAADAAQDALVTAWRQLADLQRPESFGGWILRVTRNRALTLLDRQRRAVPTGDDAVLEQHQQPEPDRAVDRLESTERDSLVWAAVGGLGERDASLLDLHLRHGLGPSEIAEELEVTPNLAHQLLFRLRGRLGTAIRAWVLWRGGEPRCDDLLAELERRAVTTFSAHTVKLIDRHAAQCARCDDDRVAVVSPTALFASVPIVVLPPDIRTRLISSLRAADVPAPSAATGAGGRRDGAPRMRRGLVAALVLVVALAGTLLWLRDDVDDGVVAGAEVRSTEPTGTTAAVPEDTTTLAPTAPAVPAPVPTAPASPADVPVDPAPGPVPPTVGPTPDAPGPADAPPSSDPPPALAPPSPPPGDQDPTVPPTTPPPTTTTAPPQTTTTTLPAPRIDRLAASPRAVQAGACPSPSLTAYDVEWATTGATTVTLENDFEGIHSVPPSGTATRCATPGTDFVLTASGPGGTTQGATPAG
jgi:RNA polymerase sigma factor (sigma-70 family)